mgnify:CR=1 FL=1
MARAKVLYWIDIGMGISFLLTFLTGLVKMPGLTQLFGFVYKTIPTLYITRVHDWAGVVMSIFVFIHLALHWKWLLNMTKRVFKWKKY